MFLFYSDIFIFYLFNDIYKFFFLDVKVDFVLFFKDQKVKEKILVEFDCIFTIFIDDVYWFFNEVEFYFIDIVEILKEGIKYKLVLKDVSL